MALDFLPEQETVQKQYYTGIGEYNEQYKNSNLNKIYKKIINQKKIRAGFEETDMMYDTIQWMLVVNDLYDLRLESDLNVV